MTEHEIEVLSLFLAAGSVVGLVAHWLDQLVSFIREGK